MPSRVPTLPPRHRRPPRRRRPAGHPLPRRPARLRRRLPRRRRLLRHLRLPHHRHPRPRPAPRAASPSPASTSAAPAASCPRSPPSSSPASRSPSPGSPPTSSRASPESTAATALSVSNFLFWQQLDYFGPDAERLPLLHTWSLGIEEQFYILFPLALAVLWRVPAAPSPPSPLLLAAQPRRRHLGRPRRPLRRLLPAPLPRLGAPRSAASSPSPPPAALPLATLGLALVLAAMAAVPLGLCRHPARSSSPAPAPASSSPSPPRRPRPRLLAHPAPRSASASSATRAYLWHQPLLAFARIRFGHLDPLPALALGGRALLLAWPTWRFVETPVPPPRPAPPPARPLLAAAATIGVLAALGAAGIAHRRPRRPHARPRFAPIMASVTDTNPWRDTCKTDLDQANPTHPVPGCLLDGARPARRLLGRQPRRRPAGRLSSTRRGPPASASTPSPAAPARRSPASPAPARPPRPPATPSSAASRTTRSATASRSWSSPPAGSPGIATEGFDNGEGGVEGDPGDFLTPLIGAPRRATPTARPASSPSMSAAVQNLLDRGLRVVLVYPIPEAGWNVPEELARRRDASAVPVTLSTDHAAYLRRQAPILAAFDAIDDPRLYRARPADALCDGELPGRCLNSRGDQPLYFDDDHVNMTGARLVAPVDPRSHRGRAPRRRGAAGQPPARLTRFTTRPPGFEDWSVQPAARAAAPPRGTAMPDTLHQPPADIVARRPRHARRATPRCTRPRLRTLRPSGASRGCGSTGSKPYTRVKNTSFDYHNVSIKWFEDGELNVAANCIDRHLATARRADRDHLGERRPGPLGADQLPPAARAGVEVRQRAARPGRAQGRPGGHLPADDPRGRLRHAGLRPHRRGAFHRLRRLLRRRAALAHRRLGREAPDHRRRGPARRPPHPAQAQRRQGAGRSFRRAPAGGQAHRRRGALGRRAATSGCTRRWSGSPATARRWR